jgi:hypothetical protein
MNLVLWCSYLDDAFIEDLKRKLRNMGYSERAVGEILKWYTQDSS